MANDNEETKWLPVIARSLALMCMKEADLPSKDLATQGRFLEVLGCLGQKSRNAGNFICLLNPTN